MLFNSVRLADTSTTFSPRLNARVNAFQVASDTSGDDEDEETARRGASARNNPDLIAKCPQFTVDVNGVKILALLDTGAEVVVMSKKEATRCRLQWEATSNMNMIAASGVPKKFLGIAHSVTIEIGGAPFSCPVWIIEELGGHEIILGMPFVQLSNLYFQVHPRDGLMGCVTTGGRKPRKIHFSCDSYAEESSLKGPAAVGTGRRQRGKAIGRH